MKTYDLIIIGAGPGGYPTAVEAVSRGLKTLVVERDKLGGTCLNRGCIPTKALCRSAEVARLVGEAADFGVSIPAFTLDYAQSARRKDAVVSELREGVATLLKDIDVVRGEARFVAQRVVEVAGEEYSAERIIVATGSQPASLPIPGAELAVNSDFMLAAETLPESIVIIGGGVIGLEFASILSAFGVRVEVLEFCREVLPGFDSEVAKRLRMALKRRGVNITVQAKATEIRATEDDRRAVSYEVKGKLKTVEAQTVLMAVGRCAVIPAGLAEQGCLIERGRIVVDDTMATTVPGVYAVGDCNGRCMLAHAATAQGRVALGERIELSLIPSAVFTQPEAAAVGLTEDACQERGIACRTATAMYRSCGKAVAAGETDGLVKLIADDQTGRLIGCHIVGAHASDLIEEATVAIAEGMTAEQLAATIHPHPSLSELLQEAAVKLCH